MELHTVEARFIGELVSYHVGVAGTYTCYRTPERRYVVYVTEGDLAWLEDGRGMGLTEGQVRRWFPQLELASA